MEYRIDKQLWNLDDERVFLLEHQKIDKQEFIKRLRPDDPIVVSVDDRKKITYINVLSKKQIQNQIKNYIEKSVKHILRTGNIEDVSIMFDKKEIILVVFPELEKAYNVAEKKIDASSCKSCERHRTGLDIIDEMYRISVEKPRDLKHLKPFMPELAIDKLQGKHINAEGIKIRIPSAIEKKDIPLKENIPHIQACPVSEKERVITIVGHPSKLGGADTELDHQIRVWQELGLHVQILHTGKIDANLKAMKMEERGCTILEPRKWQACEGTHVISYCNSEYLENIQAIRSHALSTTFVNCMTWLFPKEKEVMEKGLIDYNLYQRQGVMDINLPLLQQINPALQGFVVKPYFHNEDFPFIPPDQRNYERFRFGRIHRADTGKFRTDTKWIYETMVSPVLKEGIILGINQNCENKTGKFQDWITCYDCGAISQQEFYKRVNVIIQPCDVGHTENLPRIAFEAMSSGVPLIVDNKGGWPELVKHGETGWLCNNEREFSYYSSRMAYEREEYLKMMNNGRKWLQEHWSMDAAKKNWTKFFKHIGLIK